MSLELNLAKIVTDTGRDTLAGREEGESSRKALNLDNFGTIEDILIVVPTHVRVITPSFFIGLLAGSLRDRRAAEHVQLKGATPTTQQMWERAKSAMFGTYSPFDNLPKMRARASMW